MRKIFVFIIISVFYACDKKESHLDTHNNVVLPHEAPGLITYPDGSSFLFGIGELKYHYDEKSRLDKVVHKDGLIERVTYLENNKPHKLGNKTFTYLKDTVFVDSDQYRGTDTLIISSHNKLLKFINKKTDINYKNNYTYIYNDDGCLVELKYHNDYSLKIEYSNIPSIWKNVDLPEWFIIYQFGNLANKNGFMPSKYIIEYDWYNFGSLTFYFTYDLNNDNLPSMMKMKISSESSEYEYKYYYKYILPGSVN